MSDATETTEAVTPTPKVKKVKPLNLCWCGCGGTTKGKFVPGHDAKFHSSAKTFARNWVKAERAGTELPAMPDFVHKDAAADFQKWVNAELVKANEAADEAEKKAQDKADEKARKEAEKEAAKNKPAETPPTDEGEAETEGDDEAEVEDGELVGAGS